MSSNRKQTEGRTITGVRTWVVEVYSKGEKLYLCNKHKEEVTEVFDKHSLLSSQILMLRGTYLLCLQVSMASEIGHRWETAAPAKYWETRLATPTGSVRNKPHHILWFLSWVQKTLGEVGFVFVRLKRQSYSQPEQHASTSKWHKEEAKRQSLISYKCLFYWNQLIKLLLKCQAAIIVRKPTERRRLRASKQLPPAGVHEQTAELPIQGRQVLGQRVDSCRETH